MTLFSNRLVKLTGCLIGTSLVLSACGGSGSSDTSTASSSVSAASSASASASTSTSTAATAASTNSLSGSSSGTTSSSSTATETETVSRTTSVISYLSGFSGATGLTTAAAASLAGSAIHLTNSTSVHQAGGAWLTQQQGIQSFSTDFTFQLAPGVFGLTFCIQDSNSTTNYSPYGVTYGYYAYADANGLGYGAYSNQLKTAIGNSVAIKFDTTADNSKNYVGATPSSTGLYINGGPYMENGFAPETDLVPAGINLASGHVFAAHIVYDGSLLTMVLQDTSTGAATRQSWPIDIPAAIGSSEAWVGFTAGTVTPGVIQVNSWDFAEGYNSRLTSPTFSVAAGEYTSTQTVSLSGPAGATIYYSTNGRAPTTASTKYTGPISVSSSEAVQAIAVKSGYTDSKVATANYQIAPALTPTVNFPSGFANASNLVIPTGSASISGSTLQLTSATGATNQLAGAWYAVPVNVQSFTTSFTLKLSPSTNADNGMTFVIQNQNPASTDTSNNYVSGGPFALGEGSTGLGYQGLLSSVAVKFDPYTHPYPNSESSTGLYTNGANPGASSTMIMGPSLDSGNPQLVTLTYNGTTLGLRITDTVTHVTWYKSWDIDIPSVVGGDTAYIGFTAGMGMVSAGYGVTTWTYTN